MNIISQNTAFGGMQGVFSHTSETLKSEMSFAVYVPPKAIHEPCPVLWYLSGSPAPMPMSWKRANIAAWPPNSG